MIDSNVDKAVATAVKWARLLATRGHGVQIFLQSASASAARAVACGVAQGLSKQQPLPLYVLDGNEYAKHSGLFTPVHDAVPIIRRDETTIVYVENFHDIPMELQRDYVHLVDGNAPSYQLGRGSVLLLHVVPGSSSRLERGAEKRAIWVSIKAA